MRTRTPMESPPLKLDDDLCSIVPDNSLVPHGKGITTGIRSFAMCFFFAFYILSGRTAKWVFAVSYRRQKLTDDKE